MPVDPQGDAIHSSVGYRDPRTEQIAATAAQLLATGVADGVGPAVRLAAERLGLRHVQQPGFGRVRQHLQAMSMAAVGQKAYDADVRRILGVAEEVMTVLDGHVEHVGLLLSGRAAAGCVDGGGALHIRIYTREPVSGIAAVFVEFGYDEPRFSTVESRLGRLGCVTLQDGDVEAAVTRCVPDMIASARENLFSGHPVRSVDLAGLRSMLARMAGDAASP